MGKLNVDGTEIQVLQIEKDDYISLTDMVRNINNGPALIEKWLLNKNTIEFLGTWEEWISLSQKSKKLLCPLVSFQRGKVSFFYCVLNQCDDPVDKIDLGRDVSAVVQYVV